MKKDLVSSETITYFAKQSENVYRKYEYNVQNKTGEYSVSLKSKQDAQHQL